MYEYIRTLLATNLCVLTGIMSLADESSIKFKDYSMRELMTAVGSLELQKYYTPAHISLSNLFNRYTCS